MGSESNAITRAGASSSAIIKGNISIDDRRAILPGSRSHNMKPSLEINQSSVENKKDSKASPCYITSVKNNPSYRNLVLGLELLNGKRRKGCLRKLSTKSQSQTHLHLPVSLLSTFHKAQSPRAQVSHRNPVSFPLKRHVQRAHQ